MATILESAMSMFESAAKSSHLAHELLTEQNRALRESSVITWMGCRGHFVFVPDEGQQNPQEWFKKQEGT